MKTLHVLAAAAMLALSTGAACADSTDNRVLVAYLDGGNELPAFGDPDAYGVATVTLTPAGLCFSILLNNAVVATAAHIHSGGAGTAGAVVVALPLVAPAVPMRNAGCVAVAAATVTAIRNTPQNFYVNVHNATYPAGAARGQLH